MSISQVASGPEAGDEVVLRTGQVRWAVLSATSDKVLARRTEEIRGGSPLVEMAMMDRTAWRDLVAFGASTVGKIAEEVK